MEVVLSDQQVPGQGYVLPLAEVGEGWKVEVKAYRSNRRQAQRLAELGLTPGTHVRILRQAKSQPLLVCVRGTHLAIDRQTAESLQVRVLRKPQRSILGRGGWGRRLRGRRNRNGCSAR